MKSVTIATALLASVAIAKPHHAHQRRHQHDKRDLVVEWATEYETVTVIVDESTTETFFPSTQTPEAATTSSGSPGQFFQSASTSSTEVAAPSTTLVAKPSSEKVSAAAAATPSTTSTSTSIDTPVVVPTTSTYAPAPVEPTTTQAPAPVEPTTYAPAPASTTAAAGSGSGSNVKNTDMTYYAIGLGACGYNDAGLDLSKPVVAIDGKFWDSVSTATNSGYDSPTHPFCDQEITIKYNGKSTTGIVRDRCGECTTDAIDVSEMIFDDLVGDLGSGRVSVEWSFNSGKW